MRASRGVTLLEILVSFTLIIVATAMMVGLFVPSMSLFRRQTGKSDAYRGCVMLMEKFRIGLLNSQLETVTVDPAGQGISWQLVQDDPPFSASTGDAMMSPDFGVLYYQESETRVYYKVYRFPGAAGLDQPSILGIADLNAARSSNSSQTRVLARDIVEFKITDKDGNVALLDPPLQLSITCEINTKGRETNDVERFSLQSSVTPRSMRW